MQGRNRIVLCSKSLEYRREAHSGRVVKKGTRLNAQVKQSGVIRQCRAQGGRKGRQKQRGRTQGLGMVMEVGLVTGN